MIFSIVRFSRPRVGEGGILCCVISDSIWKMDVEKLCIGVHVHIMYRRSPFDLLHLQHVSDIALLKDAILVGVRYQRRDIFWVNSQSEKCYRKDRYLSLVRYDHILGGYVYVGVSMWEMQCLTHR